MPPLQAVMADIHHRSEQPKGTLQLGRGEVLLPHLLEHLPQLLDRLGPVVPHAALQNAPHIVAGSL